jgi:hypothetical protein
MQVLENVLVFLEKEKLWHVIVVLSVTRTEKPWVGNIPKGFIFSLTLEDYYFIGS